MEAIQFIQVTPEQLKEAILEGVQNQINELQKYFQPKNPTEFLTRREVATMLNINLTTLNNWTRKGTLKAYSIGGRVYYKRHEVESAVIELKN